MLSGCSWSSIQESSPLATTAFRSPGRGPNVSRFKACKALWRSPSTPEGSADRDGFVFFFGDGALCGNEGLVMQAMRRRAIAAFEKRKTIESSSECKRIQEF